MSKNNYQLKKRLQKAKNAEQRAEKQYFCFLENNPATSLNALNENDFLATKCKLEKQWMEAMEKRARIARGLKHTQQI